ncbi:expressed protein [Phakopsora pachyrhizi]|uniref:Expressed protein n=1 Tax=Phakopsora pachyrhizi TaxID=170000 RepID=A0AAV0BQS9_PHAPC|nr:expressed protein [Phakopsora pachyrhizi]
MIILTTVTDHGILSCNSHGRQLSPQTAVKPGEMKNSSTKPERPNTNYENSLRKPGTDPIISLINNSNGGCQTTSPLSNTCLIASENLSSYYPSGNCRHQRSDTVPEEVFEDSYKDWVNKLKLARQKIDKADLEEHQKLRKEILRARRSRALSDNLKDSEVYLKSSFATALSPTPVSRIPRNLKFDSLGSQSDTFWSARISDNSQHSAASITTPNKSFSMSNSVHPLPRSSNADDQSRHQPDISQSSFVNTNHAIQYFSKFQSGNDKKPIALAHFMGGRRDVKGPVLTKQRVDEKEVKPEGWELAEKRYEIISKQNQPGGVSSLANLLSGTASSASHAINPTRRALPGMVPQSAFEKNQKELESNRKEHQLPFTNETEKFKQRSLPTPPVQKLVPAASSDSIPLASSFLKPKSLADRFAQLGVSDDVQLIKTGSQFEYDLPKSFDRKSPAVLQGVKVFEQPPFVNAPMHSISKSKSSLSLRSNNSTTEAHQASKEQFIKIKANPPYQTSARDPSPLSSGRKSPPNERDVQDIVQSSIAAPFHKISKSKSTFDIRLTAADQSQLRPKEQRPVSANLSRPLPSPNPKTKVLENYATKTDLNRQFPGSRPLPVPNSTSKNSDYIGNQELNKQLLGSRPLPLPNSKSKALEDHSINTELNRDPIGSRPLPSPNLKPRTLENQIIDTELYLNASKSSPSINYLKKNSQNQPHLYEGKPNNSLSPSEKIVTPSLSRLAGSKIVSQQLQRSKQKDLLESVDEFGNSRR